VISHVPKGWAHQRAWTLAVLLLDTGLRIGEALSLQREHVELDAMALRVVGKGNGFGSSQSPAWPQSVASMVDQVRR